MRLPKLARPALLATFALAALPVLPPAAAMPPLRILHSSEASIVLELNTPTYSLTPADDGQRLRLQTPGLPTSSEPGQPQLPVVGALLGIPPDAEVTLHILADELDTVPLPAPLTYTSPPGVPDEETLSTMPPAPSSNEELQVANPQFYPPAPAALGPPAWLRHQRVVRLALYPFQVNQATGELRYHRRLRIALRFRYPNAKRRTPNAERRTPNDVFEPLLRSTLLNYEAARAWRSPDFPRVSPGFPQVPASSRARNAGPPTDALKLIVDTDGIYRLRPADVATAGFDPAGLDPRTFALSSQGQTVAIHVAGEADGHFDPQDYVEFYGRKLFGDPMVTKYSDENVYWLEWGGEPGPRMDDVDGTPTGSAPVPASFVATHHAEEDVIWWTHHTTTLDTRDTWWWQRLTVYGPSGRATFTTTLSGVAAVPYTATVRAEVVSRRVADINPDHHTRLYLNDLPEPIDESFFDGKVRQVLTTTVPQTALNEGENRLHFEIVNDLGLSTDDIYFNWFEVDYRRTYSASGDLLRFSVDTPGTWQFEIGGFSSDDLLAYDITDPWRPTRILSPTISAEADTYRLAFEATGQGKPEYLALSGTLVRVPKRVERFTPSGLRDPSNGADVIFITHAAFMAETQRLAEYRAAQGLRVKVVDVAALYDEFNDGIFHPVAIRNFLDFAYHHWQPPAPAYVLLVGDGHWNFKNLNPGEYGSPDPVFIPPYLAWVDPWQGEVGADHLFACVHGDDILPDLLLGRLAVNSPAQARTMVDKIIGYEATAQACADPWPRRLLFVADNSDDTGDYPAVADDIIAHHVPPEYEARRVALGVTHSQPGDVTQAIIENLNEGVLLANYNGHGSVDWWAHERIWGAQNIADLENGDRLPLVLTFNCLDGYFIYPGRPCIAEEMTRAEGKGSIASWSPAGLGTTWVQQILQAAFHDALFQEGWPPLGVAAATAKVALFAALGENELIYTQTLFGDPGLRLQQPAHCTYLPWLARR
ncbi:MAG: C25 family cysteine peptidase [Anaerolineae bacterium]|nr:C25 family cysteine peptidase [Anaerolineae bacterium]